MDRQLFANWKREASSCYLNYLAGPASAWPAIVASSIERELERAVGTLSGRLFPYPSRVSVRARCGCG